MPLLRNISQLATCPPGNPQQDAGLIRDAALVWRPLGDHVWVRGALALMAPCVLIAGLFRVGGGSSSKGA